MVKYRKRKPKRHPELKRKRKEKGRGGKGKKEKGKERSLRHKPGDRCPLCPKSRNRQAARAGISAAARI